MLNKKKIKKYKKYMRVSVQTLQYLFISVLCYLQEEMNNCSTEKITYNIRCEIALIYAHVITHKLWAELDENNLQKIPVRIIANLWILLYKRRMSQTWPLDLSILYLF